MPATSPTTPRRRWLRFSLRTFFIAVTILCCWLGWKVNAARQQREAVAAVRAQQNAGISYWFKDDDEPWLAKLFGPDLFYDVKEVGLMRQRYPGSPERIREVLPQLPNLPRLELLAIYSTTFRDEDFKYVADLKHLSYLLIGDGQITGSEFQQLARLPRLSRLELPNNPIRDEHLDQLAKLTSLKLLKLQQTEVTEAGINRLQELRPDIRIVWSHRPTTSNSP